MLAKSFNHLDFFSFFNEKIEIDDILFVAKFLRMRSQEMLKELESTLKDCILKEDA